jgi:hypothetical protein
MRRRGETRRPLCISSTLASAERAPRQRRPMISVHDQAEDLGRLTSAQAAAPAPIAEVLVRRQLRCAEESVVRRRTTPHAMCAIRQLILLLREVREQTTLRTRTPTVQRGDTYAARTICLVKPTEQRNLRTFTTWSSVRSLVRVEPNDVVSPSTVTAQFPRCVSCTSPNRASSEQTSCH